MWHWPSSVSSTDFSVEFFSSLIGHRAVIFCRVSLVAFQYVFDVFGAWLSPSVHRSLNSTVDDSISTDWSLLFDCHAVWSDRCPAAIRGIVHQWLLLRFSPLDRYVYLLGHEESLQWHFDLFLVTDRLDSPSRFTRCNGHLTFSKGHADYHLVVLGWCLSNVGSRLFPSIVRSLSFRASTSALRMDTEPVRSPLDCHLDLAHRDVIRHRHSILLYWKELRSSRCLAKR